MNPCVEGKHDSQSIISVQPTIDLPLVSDLNNNTIQQQFYNDTDTEMVTIKIIEVYENDNEPKSLVDLCLLQTDNYDTELDEILGFNMLINSKDTENKDHAESVNVLTSYGSEVDMPHEDRDLNEINAEPDDAGKSTETEIEMSHEQRDSSDTESYEVESETSRKSRKRMRNYDDWTRNVRKRRRQSGQEYVTLKGKRIRAREVKTKKDCVGKCRYKCATVISNVDRQNIFKAFWKLSDNEKTAYYMRTTEHAAKKRTRTKAKESRKKYSYKYFFYMGAQKIRVCKEFYLHTLDISQRRIEYANKNKVHEQENFTDNRGAHIKNKTSDPATEYIKKHIDSFPRIPSHYCRQTSNKEYLEGKLSLNKMYEMYVSNCERDGVTAEKLCIYRKVFNENFNIDFQKPKKDKCDMCEEHKIKSKHNTLSPEDDKKYKLHMADKTQTKSERDTDRNNVAKVVVCFDLQNVITCPRVDISNFFYKRKLSVFNLTAHCSRKKRSYNAIWSEYCAGRGGNEIASAPCTILQRITEDFPDIRNLTLWSDSCVPQNRNSIMTFALKHFMQTHPNIEMITQKFCTPGHSSIQEVDNVHRHIEGALKVAEVYSPVSLMRVLVDVQPKHSKWIQLKPENFKDYQTASRPLCFHSIPFTSVKSLRFSAHRPFHVQYKTSFGENNYELVDTRPNRTRGSPTVQNKLPMVKRLRKKPAISKEKKADILSMIKYMPPQDVEFYRNTVLK